MNQYSKRPESFNSQLFNKIDTEEKAYWLGFLYADGSVGSADNRIELTLAEKDLAHVQKFKSFIGLDNKISYRQKTKSYRFCFKNKIFKENLIKQGCIPKKSLILKFPTYSQVPYNLQRHFMRGYFDGDGCICNTENTFAINFIGTEDFIKEYLKALPNNINKQNKITNVHREHGAKRYSLSEEKSVKNWLNFLYKDASIYLERKYLLYIDFINNGKKKNK